MGLHWDVSKIKNHEEVTTKIVNGEEHWHPVTDALVWLCLFVKMGKITERNWKEFYARAHLWEKLNGARFRHEDGKPRFITPEQVYSHVGLDTNVSTEGFVSWSKELMRKFRLDCEKAATQNEKQAAEAVRAEAT